MLPQFPMKSEVVSCAWGNDLGGGTWVHQESSGIGEFILNTYIPQSGVCKRFLKAGLVDNSNFSYQLSGWLITPVKHYKYT